MPILDALLFLFIATLGSGVVIAAITAYSMRRIQQMQSEIAQLKVGFKSEIAAAEKRCDDRMRFSETALSEYADILREFAEASGRNDIAMVLAERSNDAAKIMAARVGMGITINAGADVNVGGDVAGRDKKVEGGRQ